MILQKQEMRILLLQLTLIFPLYLFSQAWYPVLVSQKMNYQHSDSSYITHTIWVESTSPSAWDTIYHLNRIVRQLPEDPGKVLRNQPQFLKKYMTRQNEESFMFYDPEENSLFMILPYAGLGEDWIFNPAGPVIALVESIVVTDVLGVDDSVRIIALSDGNEVQVSKSFGIIKFPDFDNGGYYELAGVQGTEYGESVPCFQEIFDFEVGDVFQYEEDAGDPFGSGMITRKITIESKQILPNSYIYGISGIYYCIYMDAGGGGGITSYTYSDDLIFNDSANHPANLFTNQLYLLSDSWSGYGTDRVFAKTRIFTDTIYGKICKNFGPREEDYNNDLEDIYYELSTTSDTLYKIPYPSIIGDPCGLMGHGYGNNIGQTYSSSGCFEYWDIRELSGFVKNGDTTGTITPDSLLLVEIVEAESRPGNFQVFPNPAHSVLNVNRPDWAKGISVRFEIHTLQGTTALGINLTSRENPVRVSHLPSGFYLYSIRAEDRLVQFGKLVVD